MSDGPLTSTQIQCYKGTGTLIWDGNFSYIIVAESPTALWATLNNHLKKEVVDTFKEEKFRRVAIFHEGEPFKP